MVDVTPTGQFLMALGNVMNAARRSAPRGNPAVGLPGVAASAEGEGVSVPATVGGGASVPGTATSGPNVLSSIASGGAAVGDPVANQVARSVLDRGESDRPERPAPGTVGGDIETLMSVLAAGPMAVPMIIGSLVASNAMGQPPSVDMLSTNSLLQLASEAFGDREPSGFGLDTAQVRQSLENAQPIGPGPVGGPSPLSFGRGRETFGDRSSPSGFGADTREVRESIRDRGRSVRDFAPGGGGLSFSR